MASMSRVEVKLEAGSQLKGEVRSLEWSGPDPWGSVSPSMAVTPADGSWSHDNRHPHSDTTLGCHLLY